MHENESLSRSFCSIGLQCPRPPRQCHLQHPCAAFGRGYCTRCPSFSFYWPSRLGIGARACGQGASERHTRRMSAGGKRSYRCPASLILYSCLCYHVLSSLFFPTCLLVLAYFHKRCGSVACAMHAGHNQYFNTAMGLVRLLAAPSWQYRSLHGYNRCGMEKTLEVIQ